MQPGASDGGPWLWFDSGPGDPAFNMALDEALMESASIQGAPLLRLYSWTTPAATFGYSQSISQIEAATALRPLIRRTTGGGLVPHDADWTYTLVIPPAHPWYDLRAAQSYHRVHSWLHRAFALLSVPTLLAPCARTEIPGRCFVGYEQSDLLWLGRKIAGAAQRRSRSALLIQGSVQPQPPGVDRPAWQHAMARAGQEDWAVNWTPFAPPPALLSRASDLAQTKYSTTAHNRRR